MDDLNKKNLRTAYLHMSVQEFSYLVRHIGESFNSVSKALGRNRHYLAQQTRISPMLIEKYKKIIGDTLFFDGYAFALQKREDLKQLKQARMRREVKAIRIKAEKAAERRAKRQARLNQPAL
jgi:hypothetical protein